jgi:arylsulfatase A-like enzyme
VRYAAFILASTVLVGCSDPDTDTVDARPEAASPADAASPDGGAREGGVDVAVDAASDGARDAAADAASDVPAAAADGSTDAAVSAKRPNIILLVADDLGYSDIGAFGGEISTPNLDTLASEGRILTGHRSGSLCSPTRAMIASGTDSHLAGVGRQGGGTGPQVGKPGYEGYLNDSALSIAELLRDAGYHTYIAGKWHLGDSEDRSPKARGYESSYVLLPGVATFFNEFADPPTDAQKQLYRENGVFTIPPRDFYATDFYTEKLISYIEANRGDGKPFFAFAAFTSPHWPLQAPTEYIDRYRGRYDAGYDAIRAARLARQKALGIIPQAFEPSPLLAATGDNPKTWTALTDDERKDQARRMEIYAAMVENLDANIGRLIRYLKAKGEYDDSFIFFQSDNGAEGGERDSFAANDVARTGAVDNSLANLGRKGSYAGYGPRWAEVSATPFRLWKSYTTEGGVSVPAIARLPKQHEARVRFDGLTHVTDLAPTFLEIAGAKLPGTAYHGRTVHPITGFSLLSVLDQRAQRVHPADAILAWEHGNNRYVIRDNWKLVWVAGPYGTSPNGWQLYDLATDRAEAKDLAGSRPEVFLQLTTAWEQYAAAAGVVLLPPPAPAAGADSGVVGGDAAAD